MPRATRIKPISYFKANAAEIIQELGEVGEPMIITQNGEAKAIVLTSASPRDENTIDQPTKVSPKTERLTVTSPKFTRSFPGNSLTVLRIGAGKRD